MKLWLAALVALAVLAALVTLTALGSVNGAPRGAVLTSTPPLGKPPDLQLTLGPCAPARHGTASSLRLTGPCHGVLSEPFACVGDGELRALSTSEPLGNGNRLYLTILLGDFTGPGLYFEDELTAQVIGPDQVPRWSSEGTTIDILVTPSGVYHIDSAVLLPELGTPATGVLTVEGRVVCQ